MKYVSWLTPQITVHYLSSYPIEILPSEFGQSFSQSSSDDPVGRPGISGRVKRLRIQFYNGLPLSRQD